MPPTAKTHAIVVTGASSGIGRALAVAAAGERFRVLGQLACFFRVRRAQCFFGPLILLSQSLEVFRQTLLFLFQLLFLIRFDRRGGLLG